MLYVELFNVHFLYNFRYLCNLFVAKIKDLKAYQPICLDPIIKNVVFDKLNIKNVLVRKLPMSLHRYICLSNNLAIELEKNIESGHIIFEEYNSDKDFEKSLHICLIIA